MSGRPLEAGHPYIPDDAHHNVGADATSGMGRPTNVLMRSASSGWTSRYVRDRERVLGKRWSLSTDPDLAAEQLAERLGGTARARRWAAQLVAALERRRGAA